MSHKLVSNPDWGTAVVVIDGKEYPLTQLFQNFFDDIVQKNNDRISGVIANQDVFTVATLPAVGPVGAEIFVSDETGGPVPAFSDGTNWLRGTDRTIVS